MSYQAGTNGLGKLGIPDGSARIICDGCGAAHVIGGAGNMAPPEWFLAGKNPPGWSKRDFSGKDYCRKCKKGKP